MLDIFISLGLLIIKMGRIYNEKDKYNENDIFSPEVLIILPVKGKDFEMSYNLKSLKEQSYSNFRTIAVADDESLNILKEVGIEYIISDAPCTHCNGKVRAKYSAVLRFRNFQYYVIADSDIRAERDWLEKIIRPLSKKDIGLSTAFPKFYPDGGF